MPDLTQKTQHAKLMKKSPSFMLLYWLGTAPLRQAEAVAGPVPALPEADRLAIETSLGPGVLGQEVSAPVIDDPSRFFTLTPAAKQFNIVQGPDAGDQQLYEFFPAPPGSARPGWRYRAGAEEVGFLAMQDDGSLVLEGVEDIQTTALTRYEPPEPFLPRGLAPGDQRQVRMSVRVFAAGDASDIAHQGELTVTYTYLGACRLTVPAGSFNAVVTKSVFSGTVGPARLEDTQYRFFAPGAGLLATIENRQVSALLIYRSNTLIAKVLAQNAR